MKEDISALRFYGRRKGRPLSQSMQALITESLSDYLYPHPSKAKDLTKLFPRPMKSVALEIGFGGGEHLAELAKAEPETGFIGAEPFLNGVASLLRYCKEYDLHNIKIWPDDIRLILTELPPHSLSAIYVMFPDPWPKKRHSRRRIINQNMLGSFADCLLPEGYLRMASDHPIAKNWLLAETITHPAFQWTARSAKDWRDRPSSWPQTRYMKKGIKEGRAPSWFEFQMA